MGQSRFPAAIPHIGDPKLRRFLEAMRQELARISTEGLVVQEGGVEKSAAAMVLNFLADQFNITEGPAGTVTIEAVGAAAEGAEVTLTGYTAGEDLTAGDVVFIHRTTGAPRLRKAAAGLADLVNLRMPWIGIAKSTVLSGAVVSVVVAGKIVANKGGETWVDADIGEPVYISATSGLVTKTAPTTTGVVVFRIGSILSTAGEISVQLHYIAETEA